MQSVGVDQLLVGREAEQEALRGFVRASRTGRAPVVLVAGEAGVGKTMLVERVLAGAGQPVLRGRAAQWTQAAYEVIAQALRPAIRAVPAPTAHTVTAQAAPTGTGHAETGPAGTEGAGTGPGETALAGTGPGHARTGHAETAGAETGHAGTGHAETASALPEPATGTPARPSTSSGGQKPPGGRLPPAVRPPGQPAAS